MSVKTPKNNKILKQTILNEVLKTLRLPEKKNDGVDVHAYHNFIFASEPDTNPSDFYDPGSHAPGAPDFHRFEDRIEFITTILLEAVLKHPALLNPDKSMDLARNLAVEILVYLGHLKVFSQNLQEGSDTVN